MTDSAPPPAAPPPAAPPPAAGDAAAHFTTEALGEPEGPGAFVRTDDLTPVEFLPGLGFRPVLGNRVLTNFVNFAPGARAPRHVHEEEQFVIVLEGELTFDLDGDVRVLRKGDVAVVPSWVPHGAWTTDQPCLEIDVFSPPRASLLQLAAQQQASTSPLPSPTPPSPPSASDQVTPPV